MEKKTRRNSDAGADNRASEVLSHVQKSEIPDYFKGHLSLGDGGEKSSAPHLASAPHLPLASHLASSEAGGEEGQAMVVAGPNNWMHEGGKKKKKKKNTKKKKPQKKIIKKSKKLNKRKKLK